MKHFISEILLIFAIVPAVKGQFVAEFIPPEKLIRTSPSTWFADFGKDAFGTLVLDILPETQDTLIIHLGEKISAPAQIDRKPEGSIRYVKIALPVNPTVSKYIINLPPDKRNTSPPAIALPDSFGVIMPFRYCEIENYKGEITPSNLKQKAFFWKFNMNSSRFVSSDTILNKVWDLCKYSIKATSFAGIYIDGDRERIPYEADAYINQLSHYSVDNEYTIARRTIEYFITNPTWPTEWILHTVLLFYQDYMYTGDATLLAKYYDKLKAKTLVDLARDDGLISSRSAKLNGELMMKIGFKDTTQRIRDIVDWPPAQKDTGWKLATPEGERDGYDMKDINTVVNSFHFINLCLMSDIAGRLGKKADSVWFASRSEKVKRSINSKLFNRQKGIYIDGEGSNHSSIHANMFPLAFGIVPDYAVKSVVEFIKTRGMACSVYGAQFLLEGLYKVCEADYAFSLLTSTTDRSWWNMIRSGSTITMEAWDMKYKPNSDWNHAWGTAPANIITRWIWGIKPAEPGFTKALICPQLSGLTWAEITVPTIKGSIHAQFKRLENGDEKYNFIIPDEMSGALLFFSGQNIKIIINGRKTKYKTSGLNLSPGSYEIIVRRKQS